MMIGLDTFTTNDWNNITNELKQFWNWEDKKIDTQIITMAYRIFEQTEEAQREELLQKITDSVKNLSLRELEALYYELSTKNYVND